MTNRQIKANALLFLTATIWGFAFVAQKIGAEYVGAFTFNGIRFFLGGISLLPLLLRKKKEQEGIIKDTCHKETIKYTIKAGIIAGIILFLGAGVQQYGMPYTTAAKAGFITGLYIVLVPVLGIFLKHKVGINTWIGVTLALVGLYMLSINEGFTMEFGDLLMLFSSIAFTVHILLIDHVTKRVDPILLSCIQFITCAVFSFIIAILSENISLENIGKAGIPILYGGLLSVGVAYTLQVVAQKDAKPSHAAILMSMESVVSCIGGMLILNERLNGRGIIGSILIFSAIIVSQLRFGKRTNLQNS